MEEEIKSQVSERVEKLREEIELEVTEWIEGEINDKFEKDL